MDESGNFQKPLKITSSKQIYLQIENKIYETTLTPELSKTIGPVRANENLSGPIVSSKTSVQMTD